MKKFNSTKDLNKLYYNNLKNMNLKDLYKKERYNINTVFNSLYNSRDFQKENVKSLNSLNKSDKLVQCNILKKKKSKIHNNIKNRIIIVKDKNDFKKLNKKKHKNKLENIINNFNFIFKINNIDLKFDQEIDNVLSFKLVKLTINDYNFIIKKINNYYYLNNDLNNDVLNENIPQFFKFDSIKNKILEFVKNLLNKKSVIINETLNSDNIIKPQNIKNEANRNSIINIKASKSQKKSIKLNGIMNHLGILGKFVKQNSNEKLPNYIKKKNQSNDIKNINIPFFNK